MDNLFFPPLPVPMIKDECEEIIIDAECSDDCGGKSQTDLWDEEVRRNIAKLVVYQNEKVFSAVSEEYIKLLKRNSGFIQDKQNLLDKIINHVQMFATFYQEQDNSFHQKYLDVMEEIMTVFNNVQMDMVRQIKKRGCDKSDYVTNIKAIAQNLIRLLSSTLLYNLKHILHVLLKATKHDVEPPSWKDIMNTVYAHFLIQFPLHDYSSESYCRNFLLFERWKEITRVENHKDMERTLYCRCRQTPKSVKADKVISSILMPSSVDSVTDIVTHLIKGKGNAIKSYFDYIEKQKKKSTADEPVCLNDLSFCDLDEDLERESHGSDECSKIFYDIVKDYENAKTQGIQSIAINNDEVTEEPSEEGDCIVIDDDDGPESRQRESNLVCVISDSDSDCEMVYLSNPTKKKNNIKTKSTKSTPSIPQLWSKTFPESTEKTSAISETNSRSAQGDDNDDDIEILDSECVSSVEPIGKKSTKDDFSISFERTHIQKGDSDILEVLKNLVVANDPEVIEANDEVEVANSSETDLNVVSTPDKNIQGDSNNITSNLTDSTTDHSKTNIQDGNVTENNSHHCSCCVKNKMASSPPLLISSDQNSGDNREIERGKIAQVSTEIRIEGLESMPNGHTYSYGLITPPSDQPAEGSSSPTCENVYVQIPPTDSPRSVINSESEEIALEDGILSNSTSLPAEDENAKTKNSEKDEEGENNLAEESALINESVEQNTEEVVENIADGENSATVEESHVLDEENGITEKNNEIENVTPIISEELIVFKNRPSPTNNDTSMVDSIETSVTENDKQPIEASPASVEGGEASFSTNAELTNFPQYVIINGQHYVLNNEIQNEEKGSQYQMPSEKVLTDKNYTNFVANGVYIDENGQECFVENEDNIQTVIIDNVYYSCENGLLTIEEVNQLNSNSSAEKVTEEVIENANDITNVDHPNDSNVTSNMNPEVTTKEYQNTDFNDVTSTTPPETVSEEISIKEKRRKSEENVISHSAVEESYPAAKKDSKKSKIMFTSTESIKLTDFDKFERSVNKLVDLDEQNDLWESAFSGPVTKLKSNSDATFSGDGEEMYSFQETKEKKKSKRSKSEDVCRSYSVSPIENSPEYETIETSDFKKYIQEKETILHTHSEKKKHRKHNSVLIHLDKSKIPESVLQKAKEHKKHHKTTEEAQYSPKSILKRKSVDEPATPSKKRATASASEVSCDRYKIEPEYELKKVEKERDKEKGEHSATKHHKRRSSESEKQKAIEVVFGKSRYMKHNHEHSAEESKRKSVKEPKKDHHVSFIELKNLSSYRKQQVAFSSVIRYYSKRRKVYDPQLFEMLPEVSLPFFNEKELLKKWDSQRTGKIDVNRWKTLEKYLNVHHKDRGMKRSCIQERVFYDKTTNTAEVIVYNGGSTHESSSLTSSPSYSGANNYNSGMDNTSLTKDSTNLTSNNSNNNDNNSTIYDGNFPVTYNPQEAYSMLQSGLYQTDLNIPEVYDTLKNSQNYPSDTYFPNAYASELCDKKSNSVQSCINNNQNISEEDIVSSLIPQLDDIYLQDSDLYNTFFGGQDLNLNASSHIKPSTSKCIVENSTAGSSHSTILPETSIVAPSANAMLVQEGNDAYLSCTAPSRSKLYSSVSPQKSNKFHLENPPYSQIVPHIKSNETAQSSTVAPQTKIVSSPEPSAAHCANYQSFSAIEIPSSKSGETYKKSPCLPVNSVKNSSKTRRELNYNNYNPDPSCSTSGHPSSVTSLKVKDKNYGQYRAPFPPSSSNHNRVHHIPQTKHTSHLIKDLLNMNFLSNKNSNKTNKLSTSHKSKDKSKHLGKHNRPPMSSIHKESPLTATSSSIVLPESEFSSSPKCFQEQNEMVIRCINEKSLENAYEENNLKNNITLLSDHSNFYDNQDSSIDLSVKTSLLSSSNIDNFIAKHFNSEPTDELETKTLPLKKRRTSAYNDNLPQKTPAPINPVNDEISYPATPMISIAEIEELSGSSLNQSLGQKQFKTPAEKKEKPQLPVVYGLNSADPTPIIADQFNINNHTYNNPTINYHMSNVPVPFINVSYPPYYHPVSSFIVPDVSGSGVSNFKMPGSTAEVKKEHYHQPKMEPATPFVKS